MAKEVNLVPEKLTAEELEVLTNIIKQLNSVQSQIGGLELQKHELLHTFAQVKTKLDEQQKELQDKYGDKVIDINTGELRKLLRKISIGKDYKNDAMHYSVGQEVYGGHTIVNIIEEEEKYSIYIQKGSDVIPWKDFNKNMAIAIEYNIDY